MGFKNGTTAETEAGPLTEMVVAPEPAGRVTDVDSDGWVYDVETGEVLGHQEVLEEEGRRFEVTDRESAEWVLEVRSKIEGDLAGLAARKRALVEQLDRQLAAANRRLSYWDYRFAPSLVSFARSLLSGKGRSVQFNWGKVAFRKTAGSTAIVDDAAALAYVEVWEPGLVKVKRWVGVKEVTAARVTAVRATGEDEVLPFVVSSEAGESVTISTGIDVKGKP